MFDNAFHFFIKVIVEAPVLWAKKDDQALIQRVIITYDDFCAHSAASAEPLEQQVTA